MQQGTAISGALSFRLLSTNLILILIS